MDPAPEAQVGTEGVAGELARRGISENSAAMLLEIFEQTQKRIAARKNQVVMNLAELERFVFDADEIAFYDRQICVQQKLLLVWKQFFSR